jgi:hypothetical protein
MQVVVTRLVQVVVTRLVQVVAVWDCSVAASHTRRRSAFLVRVGSGTSDR